MAVLGVGLDLVSVARVAALLARHGERIERKLFTDAERAYCQGRAMAAEHFAARFAAKEAFYKALAPDGAIPWHDVEVRHDARGRPTLALAGKAAAACAAAGVARVHLALTHERAFAAAQVLLEGEP